MIMQASYLQFFVKAQDGVSNKQWRKARDNVVNVKERIVGAHGIPTADEVRLALIDALLMLDRAGVEVAHRVAAELRQKCSPALPPSRLPEEPSRVAAPVAIQGGVRVAAQNASALLKAKFMGEVADLLLSIKVALQKVSRARHLPRPPRCLRT